MSTLYERLKEICRDQGMEKPRNIDIQELCGLSSGRITQIKQARDAAKLGEDTITLLAKKGYSPEWVQNGTGAKTLSKKPPQLINLSEHPDLSPVRRVRFKLAAGVHGYAVELDNGDAAPIFFRKDWLALHNYQAEKLVAVRVSGSSMEPNLWDGDLVVVNLADTQPHDGDVFAVSYEGEPGIKRLRRDAGEWWLTSDNADQRRFAPKRCTDDVEILGRVIYKQSDHI